MKEDQQMKPETEDDRTENLLGKLRFADEDRREIEVKSRGIGLEFLGRRRVEGQQRGIAENAIAGGKGGTKKKNQSGQRKRNEFRCISTYGLSK